MFFACDWIVERDGMEHLDNLYVAAVEFGCLLWREGFTTQVGFDTVKFVIQVPTRTVLSDFVERAGKPMSLVDWYPVQMDEKDVSDVKTINLKELSGNLHATIMGGLFESAIHNEELRGKFKSNA